MTSEKIQIDTVDTIDPVVEKKASKLLPFDENNTVSTGKDINTKITILDSDLAQLRAELVRINMSVDEGLDRLGDTDTDLTAKVSETYKRLGEIDNAYKALMAISSRIDTDIQKLNGDVSSVAVQSASGLKNLEQTTIAQSNEFTQKNQIVVSEVNKLVATSKLTSELLSQKIQSTTDTMMQIEKNVVAEIERLADSTKDKTNVIQNTVEANKARIIKLQSVDEAIIRRATTLEISSAELMVKNQHVEASVEQLHKNTENLSAGLEALKERTQSLEALTAKHSTFIGGLQKATEDITAKLNQLAGTEKRHFSLVTFGFILLLIVTAVIYFSTENQFAVNESLTAERSTAVDDHLFALEQVQVNDSMQTGNTIAALQSKLDNLAVSLQDNLRTEVAAVEAKVVSMSDQVQSVEGRLNQSSPFSNIGDDNIIHGTSWIAGLPANNFVVQLANVDNKSAMYEIADRYNHYLKDSLSKFEVQENGVTSYVLLSGNYSTQQQAQTAISAMPAYINMQRPVVRKVSAVQKYIAIH